jgi:hypothetical protein
MSFPRLTLLFMALGLPLLAGGCGVPLAVSAGTYGADAASVVETGKSGSDHFVSMVSTRDCALWRVFRGQSVCRDREGDPNPYKVNYDQPYRSVSDGGTEYMAPLHQAAGQPTASWDAKTYDQPKSPATSQPSGTGTASSPASDPQPPSAVTADASPQPVATPAPPVKDNAHIKARSAQKKKKKKPVKRLATSSAASPAAAGSPAPTPTPTPSPDPAGSGL